MTEKATILIAEDDEAFANQLAETLAGEDHHVVVVNDGRQALEKLSQQPFDLGFIDISMPGIDGMQVLEQSHTIAPAVPLIIITGFATIERAIKATRLGAYDFIEKPVSLDRILITTEHALEKRRLQLKNVWMADDILARYKMIGASREMQKIYTLIDQIAPTDSTTLITGETGTGKELVAMALHIRSQRSAGPIVKVNCAAIPDTIIESELFGHKRGAFTGAIEDRQGKFIQANGGTLFLDEIGDLSPSAQSKILRVLQEKEVQPVGATSIYKINVRTITATNKNLEDLLSDGSFREDLYYRINVVNIHLPPLRERIEDIPKLADHFLRFFCEQNNRYIQDFEPQAMQLMLQYNWPGNVRELRSVVERLAIFVRGDKITVDNVAYVLSTSSSIRPNKSLTYNEAKTAFQKEFITQALIAHDWNVSAAAITLDIDRTNLHKKMQRLGIQRNT